MEEMQEAANEFLSYIASEKALSDNTTTAYQNDLRQFFEFCRVKKIDPEQLELKQARQFLASLDRRGMQSRSVARKLSAVKQFYQFLVREDIIDTDPLELIGVSVKARRLPKCLSVEEMAAFLEAANGKGEIETRDRALLELWYATGARIGELASLTVSNVDFEEGLVKFSGKGKRERLVPAHRAALDWCQKYKKIRHDWLAQTGLKETQNFFVNHSGRPLNRQAIWKLVKQYAEKAGIKKRVWPHMIRHTFATHVLNGGADLRAVQALLGHRSIATTEIYTHLNTENLKVMQMKYHPRD